jgi:hypothetical protein
VSSDEAFVVRVLGALKVARLEAVVVGNVAAILEGAPVTTQDLDLLVRDTVTNRRKITALGVELGSAPRLISELSETLRIDLAAQARGRDQVQRGGRSSQGPRTAPDPRDTLRVRAALADLRPNPRRRRRRR